VFTCTDLSNRRNWKVVLEENRKLVQNINDHPGTEKTQIQTGATEDCNLVPTGKKLTLVREVTEGLYSREGTPLCRGNLVGRVPDKPVEVLSSVGRGKLLLFPVEEGE
jgi:hypothetical protein